MPNSYEKSESDKFHNNFQLSTEPSNSSNIKYVQNASEFLNFHIWERIWKLLELGCWFSGNENSENKVGLYCYEKEKEMKKVYSTVRIFQECFE